jgi:2-dehydro-3-deoxy-D-arabinonate dehydratase
MPICYFRPREHAHDARVLGWVDLSEGRVAALSTTLAELLAQSSDERDARIAEERAAATATHALDAVTLLAPVDQQEIWAAGVTYERSRDARMEESTQEDVYDRVYQAARPEIFFKSPAWRCVGPHEPVAIRHDSAWNVPEPELALVIDRHGHIAGYTIGNDVSSRSIEGENPLYLPQAKVYTASCALGPWIVLSREVPDPLALSIHLRIDRDGQELWGGETSTASLHRTLDDLTGCLYAALEFPAGAVLMTGTRIVPPSAFTLEAGDSVTVTIDGLGTLTNNVYRLAPRS